tara:strand:- start:39988 stop:40878 length:891 start_codon:yes stop_codon:yes gene_type:complete
MSPRVFSESILLLYPGAIELCDGVDNDCNTATPEPLIVHNGTPVGDLRSAIEIGGQIDICGPVELSNTITYLQDVTIVGHTDDAAILIAAGRLDFVDAEIVLSALRIAPRSALVDVHGIRVTGGSIAIEGSVLTGFSQSPALLATRAPITMEDSEVRNNTAGNSLAGGVHFDRSEALFRNVAFEDNTSGWFGRGGGALFIGPGSDVTMEGCSIRRNHHTASGIGGVYMGEANDVVMGVSTLRATDCDWGLNAEDNDLFDIVVSYRLTLPISVARIAEVTTNISCTASPSGNSCSTF